MRYGGVAALILILTACGARSELDGTGPSTLDDASVPEGDGGPTSTVLAEGSPFAIAVDTERVYWSTVPQIEGELPAVVACSTAGCGGNPTKVMTSLAPAGGSVDSRAHTLAVNATNVYWIASRPTQQGAAASILACPKSGCATAQDFAAGIDGDQFVGVAANDDDVYWTFGGYGGNVGGSVMTCPAVGCQGVATTFADHQTTGDLAIDGTELVWPNLDGVVQCSLTGCTAPTLVASVPFFPTSIAAGAGTAAWARAGGIDDCVGECGKKPTLLAPELEPGAVATDGTNAYWVANLGGPTQSNAILKCSLTHCNGSPQTLTTFSGIAGGIAVDATIVYWTIINQSKTPQGKVMKLTPK